MSVPPRTLSIGDHGPPPPLAGALAAWWARRGEPYVVGRDGPGEVWVHLEGAGPHDLGPRDGEVVYFGPGVDAPDVRATLSGRVVQGDPEGRVEDLGTLPITTWHGFPALRGVARVLAGRGDRVRPVAHVLREVVYLVETHAVGTLLFDDADLAAFPGWIERFDAELWHLPWTITWEGNLGGARRRGLP